jgi:hypothetical protein
MTGEDGDAAGINRDKAVDTRNKNSFFNNRLLLTALVVVSAGFAFIILGILETDHKKTIAVVRVTLLWTVAIYLLIAYAGDAVRIVRTVGGSIDRVKHQSGERGKKAAKAIKDMKTFVDEVGQVSSTDVPEEVQEKKE